MRYQPSLSIDLSSIQEGLKLFIEERSENRQTLFLNETTEDSMYEAPHQLLEGQFYDFEFSNPDFCFSTKGGRRQSVVHPRKRNPHIGTIEPNIYVGTLRLDIARTENPEQIIGYTQLEVQSVKAGYRDDYRNMLEYITDKCTSLLMQSESFISQPFEVNYDADFETLYQRFSFIRSVVGSDDFSSAVHRIVTAPVTGWKETTEMQDVRRVRRFNGPAIRQITRGQNRQHLDERHQLRNEGISSLPSRIDNSLKTDTVDTPENRFIKHVLETFARFCAEIREVARKDTGSVLFRESDELLNILEAHLQHNLFNDISRPTTLRINSPVLQRKSGYREVLQVWLMSNLAAKLIWKGGEDVYQAGKKDIATLYEYWLFFQLLDLFSSVFSIPNKKVEDLIKKVDDELNLTLKQGKETALEGTYDSGSRSFNVKFSYNRIFRKAGGDKSYPKAGSWTSTMRPDYTLSIWPSALNENEAEHEELIVHIHFDAKYKVENIAEHLKEQSDEDLSEQKSDERKGRYKNADLLKMHAYKDAIRRTSGAYVLYPGDTSVKRHGFHEIIPGLGAFPVKPSKDESGIFELRVFIKEVMSHFENRVSQREKVALGTYSIHKDGEPGDSFTEFVPEAYGKDRDLIADQTFVLVGYCKSEAHHQWIKEQKLYNFRMDGDAGSLVIDKATVGARYLLIHRSGQISSPDLFEITSKGPAVYSAKKLSETGYPDAQHSNYLVVKLKPVTHPGFKNKRWDFTKLQNYRRGRATSLPFTATLAELMGCVVTEQFIQ